MANETAWQHFGEITLKIGKLKNDIKQIAKDIDRLMKAKEEILGNQKFKSELKKIIDIYPKATIESLNDDCDKFQALRKWMEDNGYI